MNINERVRLIRKSLNMNQKEFGYRIAAAQTYLSSIENGQREVTEKIIKLISFEFGVNESWLRTGEGEMFQQLETFSLDDEAKKNNLSELEIAIMRSYMSLDCETREKLMDGIEAHFKKKYGIETAATVEQTPEQFAAEEAEKFRLEMLAELKGATLPAFVKQNGKSS